VKILAWIDIDGLVALKPKPAKMQRAARVEARVAMRVRASLAMKS
jgi:hypothetical protein